MVVIIELLRSSKIHFIFFFFTLGDKDLPNSIKINLRSIASRWQCARGLFLFFHKADRTLILLGASSWTPPRQPNRRVLGGDKTLNVLSRLFRNVGEELRRSICSFPHGAGI